MTPTRSVASLVREVRAGYVVALAVAITIGLGSLASDYIKLGVRVAQLEKDLAELKQRSRP